MPKSIRPGVEVFQYAIRHKPTGKYLKKIAGSTFYETDIPAVYNSPKVALRSLENQSKWGLCKYKVADCEIIKFRLIMEEVKEPTKQELDYANELKNLQAVHKIAGEFEWTEVEGEHLKREIYYCVKHLDALPIKKSNSLHCYSEQYQTFQGTFEFTWIVNSTSEMPDLIMRGTPIDWERKYVDLKKKYRIS